MSLNGRPSPDSIVLHINRIVSLVQDMYADAAMVDNGKFSSARHIKSSIPGIKSAIKDLEKDLLSRMVSIRKTKEGMGHVDDFDEPIDDPMES
jgi:hypothetical protein